MRFEWDPVKDGANRKKHGIGFGEAQELLESVGDYLEVYDTEHSDTEERFIAIGPIRRGLVLVVWTERSDETVRIISARFATAREQALYREFMEER